MMGREVEDDGQGTNHLMKAQTPMKHVKDKNQQDLESHDHGCLFVHHVS